MIINISVPNIGVPREINHLIANIKEHFGNNIVIVGGFNTSLTSLDRSSTQKINMLDHMDLVDINRTLL